METSTLAPIAVEILFCLCLLRFLLRQNDNKTRYENLKQKRLQRIAGTAPDEKSISFINEIITK